MCVVLLAVLAPLLVVPNLAADYRMMGGDSQDWIANGLAIAGADVRYSVRPPLLPLVIALLDGVSMLELLPVALLALQLAAAVVLYLFLRRRVSASLAFAVSVGTMGCFSWLGLGLEVMADVPAACLLFAGVVCFVAAAEDDDRRFVPAGVLLGLSAVAQPLAWLFPLPAVAAVVVHRRDLLKARRLWLGALLFVAPSAAWLGYKGVVFGTAGDVVMQHWSLLGAHFGGIVFSVMSGLSMLGAVGAVLAVAGLGLLARRARVGFTEMVLVGVVVVVAVFIVFGYRFHAKRLLVYLVPFAAVAIAEALAGLRRPPLRWAVALLAVGCAWLPLPGGPGSADSVALWPLPPVYLRASLSGGIAPTPPTALRLEFPSLAEIAGWTVPARLASMHHRGSSRRPPPASRFAGIRTAVWIHDGEVPSTDRYARSLRVGNLLRKRVNHVPLSVVEPLAPWLRCDSVTGLDGLQLYRARLPGVDGTWVVIVDRGGRADAWAARRRGPPSGEGVPGLACARRIAGVAEGRQVVVVTAGGVGPSLALLPFLLRVPELYVMDPATYTAAAKKYGAVRRARLEVVDGITVWGLDVTGREWVLVDATGGSLWKTPAGGRDPEVPLRSR